MTGRINKVDMTAKLMKIKHGIHEKQWYPKWKDDERLEHLMQLKNKVRLIIACDGGAASGKTTGAKRISKKIGRAHV